MKLIIWWLALLTILPLLYLGWWKKGWRLILGVTIAAILIASFFIPEEIISSLTRNEIAKEIRNKIKKIDELIHKSASTQETNSENPEKVEEAKNIIKSEKVLKDLKEEYEKLQEEGKIPESQATLIEYWKRTNLINFFKNNWVKKWNKELSSSAILFCGKEFNQTLTTNEYKIEERNVNFLENTINFDDYQDKNAEEIKEKLLEIIKKEEYEKFSIAFLKNVNKISKQEVKELLLKLLGQGADASFWKYNRINSRGNEEEVIPNLSKFVFIASISNSDSKNLEELQKNFRTVEMPWSKNQLVIFSLSGGVEVIIFFFLTRNKRKSQHEKLQQLD
jgi:hypothetical protein